MIVQNYLLAMRSCSFCTRRMAPPLLAKRISTFSVRNLSSVPFHPVSWSAVVRWRLFEILWEALQWNSQHHLMSTSFWDFSFHKNARRGTHLEYFPSLSTYFSFDLTLFNLDVQCIRVISQHILRISASSALCTKLGYQYFYQKSYLIPLYKKVL